MVVGIEKEMQVAPIEPGRDNTPITLPARTPLTFEQACRAVGLKLRQPRRYMADPDFKRNFDGVLSGYRVSLAPGNIAIALGIRNDESIDPKARLKACEYLDGPRPLANGVQVNVTQNNSAKTTMLPGYVIRLNDPAAEPKTIEHRDTPVVPAKSGNVGDNERDARREAKELAKPRPSRG